ncbi:MAG: hypothetical protein WCL53_09535 [Chloroflexota bacterium]
MNGRLTEEFDEALELLQGTGPEFHDSKYSNHGPMAAEALGRLGRADAIVPWVRGYRGQLDVHPRAFRAIEGDYREALGDLSRFGDWVAFFDRELAADSWRAVLERWIQILAPGVAAAATHGVIRTAHAVRALADREDALRIHEVAEGLGYWAARYQPIVAHAQTTVATPSVALAALPMGVVRPERNIMETLARVGGTEQFRLSAGLVSTELDADAFIDDITVGFAHAYLTNVRAGASPIPFIHGVTGPRAVRILVSYVPTDVGRELMRWTWLAAAAIYEGYAEQSFAIGSDAERAVDFDDLIEQAVSTNDEHAIKFTEACLDQYAQTKRFVFLEAASDVVVRLA